MDLWGALGQWGPAERASNRKRIAAGSLAEAGQWAGPRVWLAGRRLAEAGVVVSRECSEAGLPGAAWPRSGRRLGVEEEEEAGGEGLELSRRGSSLAPVPVGACPSGAPIRPTFNLDVRLLGSARLVSFRFVRGTGARRASRGERSAAAAPKLVGLRSEPELNSELAELQPVRAASRPAGGRRSRRGPKPAGGAFKWPRWGRAGSAGRGSSARATCAG